MAEDQVDRRVGEQLLTRYDDGVLWLTLNRPEAGGAVTPDQRDRLVDLLAEASGRIDVRVVVLGSTGKHFCTGADLRAGGRARAAATTTVPAPPRPDDAPDRVVGDVSRLLRRGAQRLVAAVLDCEKPVIAAVNGTAAGLGMHLALACDLVVASESARFIEVFVRRGLVPDAGGAWLLPRLIGVQRAKELMFFGDDVPASRAEQLGLVNRVVPAEALDDTVSEWAKRLAAGPTLAIGLAKRLVNRSLDVDRATAFDEEAFAQEANIGTHDADEGVRAFVERRDPNFRGW
jgi:2-(1,2-epoxy-1,2-dihydrophenyl)acetyl-CoA isomerase